MLFSPYKIRNKIFKNRIIMLPTVTNFATENGFVTQKNIDYYKIRAKGPAAIICEASYTHLLGKCFPNQVGIDGDDKIEGLSRVAKVISEHGIAGIQLALNVKTKTVNELSRDEIFVLRDSFVSAALRAKKAGFELIELHFAHGWLLNQFLSRAFNKRVDEYGGNLENRMRLALEIVEMVKDKVNDDMIISARVNANDYAKLTTEDFKLEEAIAFSKRLEKYGVDIISVSAGVGQTTYMHVSPMSMPKATLVKFAQKIKENVGIPVIAADRLNYYEIANDVIKSGKADFIGIARGLIADPHLIEKWQEKRFEDVVPCIACNQACIAGIQSQKQLSCLMEPVVYEGPVLHKSEMYKRKILIIGAGPAGLSCAKYLKMRGMDVVLCERENEIGGQLRFAYIPPNKSEFKKVLDYFEYIIKKLNIDLRLNTEVDEALVKQIKPDIVILAAGSKPIVPVFAKNNPVVITADELLKGEATGKKVAVLGAGLVGLETAQYLLNMNKEVEVFEMKDSILSDMPAVLRRPFLESLNPDMKIFVDHKVENIKGNTLILKNLETNKVIEKEFDTIILALGRKADKGVRDNIKFDKQIIEIGDYRQVRDAQAAIKDGFEVAMGL